MRSWQLTLTPAPGEEPLTRTVDHDGMVSALHALMSGELPWDADLAVTEIGARNAATESELAA